MSKTCTTIEIPLSREYIEGTFAFDIDAQGRSVVSFVPKRHFQPNVLYQVLLLGDDASLTINTIKNPAGETMTASYQWSFQTGDLNLTVPPVQSLLIQNTLASALNPVEIKILPRKMVGVDLTQVIDIIFPGPIDPDSFDLNDLMISIEPVLGDPRIAVPPNLQPSNTVFPARLPPSQSIAGMTPLGALPPA
jgi:hypothetical protein